MIFKLLFLTYLVINFISILNNLGKKSTILPCGLVGYNGSVPPNQLALRILGKFNEARGTHSCGVSSDFEIKVGVGKLATFSDFSNTLDELVTNETTNNVIIHTRKATVGAHTVDNAHPFGFGGEEDSEVFDFVGAHNGSLIDWEELNPGQTFTVDSKALLNRIYSDKNYKVLSEYKGDAALIFYFKDKKDNFYAFKGAAGDKEERPLYYVQIRDKKTKKITGVYLSSMPESLKFIFPGLEIKEVPNNTLITFKGGKIINSIKIKRPESLSKAANEYENYYGGRISARKSTVNKQAGDTARAACNLSNRSATNSSVSSRSSSSLSGFPKIKEKVRLKGLRLQQNQSESTYPSVIKDEGLNALFNSYESLLIPKIVKGHVECKYLRYWRNGHKLDGIYILSTEGAVLSHGFTSFEKAKEYIVKSKKDNKIPKTANIFSFIDGVLLKNASKYDSIKTDLGAYKGSSNHILGNYSVLPVCPLYSRNKKKGQNLTNIVPGTFFYYNTSGESSALFDRVITPLFSLFTYTFQKGDLISIHPTSQLSNYTNKIFDNVDALSNDHYIKSLFHDLFLPGAISTIDITQGSKDQLELELINDDAKNKEIRLLAESLGIPETNKAEAEDLELVKINMLEVLDKLVNDYIDLFAITSSNIVLGTAKQLISSGIVICSTLLAKQREGIITLTSEETKIIEDFQQIQQGVFNLTEKI